MGFTTGKSYGEIRLVVSEILSKLDLSTDKIIRIKLWEASLKARLVIKLTVLNKNWGISSREIQP